MGDMVGTGATQTSRADNGSFKGGIWAFRGGGGSADLKRLLELDCGDSIRNQMQMLKAWIKDGGPYLQDMVIYFASWRI